MVNGVFEHVEEREEVWNGLWVGAEEYLTMAELLGEDCFKVPEPAVRAGFMPLPLAGACSAFDASELLTQDRLILVADHGDDQERCRPSVLAGLVDIAEELLGRHTGSGA